MSEAKTPTAVDAGDTEPANQTHHRPLHGAVIGVLIGFKGDGFTPLVIFPGQPGHAAVTARSTCDLQGAHIGREVALIFEEADAAKPLVVGLFPRRDSPLAAALSQVSVDADGERLIVSARERLVLRCGLASITLTRTGKVLIEGAYVSSNSSGVNRVKGGSIQLN
jgi:hypothetical protein